MVKKYFNNYHDIDLPNNFSNNKSENHIYMFLKTIIKKFIYFILIYALMTLE